MSGRLRLLSAACALAAAALVAVPATPGRASGQVLEPGPGGFVAVTPFRLVDTR